MTAPTFDDLLRDAAARFREAGISEPRQNAMLLMLGAFGDTRAALISAGASPVPRAVQDVFEAGVARRLAREPLQHITGSTGFYGLEILTDPRALIPRPDSELIVETALDLLPEGEAVRVADLGTGTGCLLAAILSQRPLARGVGVEASPGAASLARENFAALGLTARADVFEGSWTAWTGWGEADLIVSNPPYIARAEIAALEPEVRAHDPAAALDGGPDGLDAYREIIRLAAAGMRPEAPLVLEIGHDQRAAVLGMLAAEGFADLAHSLDLGGNDRCVWGRAPGPVG
ncbi:MAG: peptide chain release factor N(5)-glutamine methyltransferase [Acidobacteria bacterium]|nr:peptide chain release factor N(5)-glutamine methyltransferase [Acidobacteriota bacterium]